jgi:hypothetical protein
MELKAMTDPRPTIPSIPELIDIRRRQPGSGADDALFGGWGVRLTLPLR